MYRSTTIALGLTFAVLATTSPAAAQNFRVSFRDVSQVEVIQTVPTTAETGELTGNQSSLVLRATQLEPAQVMSANGWEPEPGATFPFDFLKLDLTLPIALSTAASDVVKERLADCTRFASLVQARPDKYSLVLRIDLGGQTTAVSQGDTIAVILQEGGAFRCKLVRG